MLEALALIAVGLFAGLLAAALGLGGGIVFVPALAVLFSFDQHLAQGTSLAVIVPTAAVATVTHARLGNVRWRLAWPIALIGLGGALLGAQIALQLDADLLRRIFGVFLVLLAVRMGWRARRMGTRADSDPEEP